MTRWLRLALGVALSLSLAGAGHAQDARPHHARAGHFVYTGELRSAGSVVATATDAPLSRVRFVGDSVAVTVQGEGLTLAAEGARAGLAFHVHGWTMATARGFQLHVPPEARLEVREGSSEQRVLFDDTRLGQATLGRPHPLPGWLLAALARTDLYTHCAATRLYTGPREAGEPLELEEGMTIHVHPTRGELEEAWVMLDGRWVRGYARDVRCEAEDIGGGLGIGGVSSSSDPPPHVLLPAGLVLVAPARPERPVLRVSRPVDAIDWGPGWTAANDEGALWITLPCGLGDTVGHVHFTPTQLVPRGAPLP